ncbi:hypothetical protein Tco_0913700 [Tanacetum coccineum]
METQRREFQLERWYCFEFFHPISAVEIQAVEKERKAKNILLMAIPKEHMRRFHGMDDAKEIWEAIRTRFGGNANSKKMPGAHVLNLSMTMKLTPESDTLSIDDLYNNLRIFEQEIQDNEEMDIKLAIAMIAISNEESSMKKTGRRVRVDGKTPIGFDKKKLECFNCHNTEDSIGKPLYSRFTKINEFKGVPHPLSGDYTPRPQEEIDDSLYVYGRKGPKTEISVCVEGGKSGDDNSSEHSPVNQNDRDGLVEITSEAHLLKLNKKYKSISAITLTRTSNSLSPKRPQMNQINQRRDFSKPYSSVRRPFAKTTEQMSHVVMGNWESAVKTSASYNWRNSRPNFNYNSGPTFIRTMKTKGPQGRPKPVKAWVKRINWRILKNSMGDLLPLEFTMSNRHKDWLVQEQTALGKDFSNPVFG